MVSTFSLNQGPEMKSRYEMVYSFKAYKIKRKSKVMILFWSYSVFANLALWTHLTDVHLLQQSRHVACNPVVPF